MFDMLLRNSRVLFMTLAAAGRSAVHRVVSKLDALIVDEAAQGEP